MLKIVHKLAVGLLIFVAAGALYAGSSFIKDPSGAGLGMNTSYLSHSPFSNYCIPGMVLFIVNGILSLVAACTASKKQRITHCLSFQKGYCFQDGSWYR